jgi:drug/metabolite transporter (DMT)-like permease
MTDSSGAGSAASGAPRATTAPPRTNRVLLGILFMCTASTLFPIMNGLVKLLGGTYAPEQIVWARILSHLVFVLMIFLPTIGFAVFRTNRPGSQFVRSMMQLLSTSMFFFGVQFIPLADAAAISFMGPFIVTLMAVPMLGERISTARLIAVLVGFFGVLIVIRPGTEVFQWHSVLIIGSATCYALYQVLTRKVAGHDSPATSAVYSALLGSAVLSLLMPFRWQATPDTWHDIVLLSSLGILGGVGHYCVARAMMYAPANVISPFMYFQMIGSVLVGWLLFEHLPDAWTWLGAAVLIGSGLYIGWRETRERRMRTSAVPAAAD